MLSTIVFASAFAGLLLASIVLWALFLRLGLYWAKAPDVNKRRVVLVSATVVILQIAINCLSLMAGPTSDFQQFALGLAEFAAGVFVACAVIASAFGIRWLQALQAWLPTLLATFLTVAFALLVLRPYVYEAFVVPTNAMAPTLVGEHWRGICSECGQPNYCTPRVERYAAAESLRAICDEFHVTKESDIDHSIYGGDRFMVAKFLTARRWDLVVFRHPEQPTTLNVKRLVGFPGETIRIQNGSVWINGEEQQPPDSIRNIEYLSELPDWFGPDLWGSLDRPATLGKDEYFVLGDFSAESVDSRSWEQGAPGHNPFAVPESYMLGVVTHTYWPPNRWRIHR